MWKKRGKSKRDKENEMLLEKIKEIFYKHKKRYGSPRITAEMRSQGYKIGKNRIVRLMKENNLRAKTKKRFKITTKSKDDKPVAQDLVKRNFTAERVNALWTSDITYIWTAEGWLYLSIILDVCSRKIIGWCVDKYLKKDIVKRALQKAVRERSLNEDTIFHSDRGCQYGSKTIVEFLKIHNIKQSMSGKGNCYDNAISETFFHTIKTELIYSEKYMTREEAMQSIFEYIEIYYNRQRRHSSLKYITPDECWRLKKSA